MSQEDLEVIRRGYEYFAETGDFREEIMHPDFVWDMSTFRDWPERQTYAGLEGREGVHARLVGGVGGLGARGRGAARSGRKRRRHRAPARALEGDWFARGHALRHGVDGPR